MQTKKQHWNFKFHALIPLLLLIFFAGCKKQELTTTETSSASSAKVFGKAPEGDIPYVEGPNYIFGDPNQNPYTVANMNIAWEYLASQGYTDNSGAKVRTTHYYVKFKPQNSDQYELLHQDSTLAFSDFPIENNVIQNGDYYQDPEVPDTIPTYQYTAVPVNYVFPKDIPYEIIDELYIPEADELFGYKDGSPSEMFVDRLLNQAYFQTNNFDDMIPIEEARRHWYTPGGNIQVFDTRLQRTIGMQGVRVQARRWFTFLYGIPDNNGDYRMNGQFKRPCNYSIWFATPRFTVRQRFFNITFWINGPKITGDWNYTLNNGYQRFAGHVFRGAYRYNFRGIGGLLRPLLPFGRQLYVALDKPKSWSGINYQPLPYIRIARYNIKKREYDSDEIFSTTVHETAHSSHYSHVGIAAFASTPSRIRESWAVGIEWYITHMEYAERGVATYGDENYDPTSELEYPNRWAYQFWHDGVSGTDGDYTSLFINLVDKYDEFNRVYNGYPGSGIVDDQIVGYNFPDLELKVLPWAGQGWNSFVKRLKDTKPGGITDQQIDLLISFYH